ncbi:MAG: hypothetical protein OEX19_09695, partial [Gammaproteobacteria bacterium]|nr:hypothetical protein [Gammaproteobacteria bacterium]
VKYWKALNEYHYYNSQKEMAERLHHTEAWLSRFLDLASIPAEVTDAFPSIFEIKVEHAKVLKPFLKRDKTKKELIKRAKEINQQQEANLAQEKAAMPASKVISLLTEIFKEKKSKQVSEYLAEDGSKLFIIEQKGRGALSISLTPKAKGNKDETLKQLNEALEALYGE